MYLLRPWHGSTPRPNTACQGQPRVHFFVQKACFFSPAPPAKVLGLHEVLLCEHHLEVGAADCRNVVVRSRRLKLPCRIVSTTTYYDICLALSWLDGVKGAASSSCFGLRSDIRYNLSTLLKGVCILTPVSTRLAGIGFPMWLHPSRYLILV